MMKRIPLLAIALAVLWTSSALSQEVRYNFDKTSDFAKFKTYKWVALESVAPIDKLTDEQVKAALDGAFARKGLSKVTGDGPADLLIGYQTSEKIEEKFAGLGSDYGVGSGWYRNGWYVPSGGTTSGPTSTIYKGELAVDMYDPADRSLVWRGVASKSLDPKADAKKRQKNLDKAVTNLMKNYPPPANK
jgi:hypothetical protein